MNIDEDGKLFINSKLDDGKRFVTTRLIQVAAASILLGGGLAGIIGLLLVRKAAAGGSGDTPVVLVGGSLGFKSGAQSGPPDWTTVASNPNDYYLRPGYSITKIVVKSRAPADGGTASNPGDNSSADRLSVDVSDADSWQIDAFTEDSPNNSVATITQNASTTEIHVVKNNNAAFFCNTSNKKVVNYGLKSDCSDPIKFTSISVTVDKSIIATFACKVLDGDQGKCRIVLKGNP